MRQTTLGYIFKKEENKILLAMKKRGFGVGRWNGFGGKLMVGETVEQALIREAKEEINVDLNLEDLVKVATIEFIFQNNPEWNQQSHVFFIYKWGGEPEESEEMKPLWYDIDEIPYESMWVDDPYWLPRALKGEKLNISFTFNSDGEKLLDMKVESI